MSSPCPFGALLPRSFPHILEEIFLYLDYESFKTCFEVCKIWREHIKSDLLQRKAKDIFSAEIEEDGKKLTAAAREGRITFILGHLSTNMVDINMWFNSDYHDEADNDSEEEYYTATPLFEAATRMDSHSGPSAFRFFLVSRFPGYLCPSFPVFQLQQDKK